MVRERQLVLGRLDEHPFGDALQNDIQLVSRPSHLARVELGLTSASLLGGGDANRLIRLAALSQIARDLGVASERALAIVQRRHEDGSPEARAVLADAQSLFFEPPVLSGVSEDLGRPFGRPIVLGEEDRVGLPDDLLGRIAFDSPGARVP